MSKLEVCRNGCGTCSSRKRLRGKQRRDSHSHPLCVDFDDLIVGYSFMFFGAGTLRETK